MIEAFTFLIGFLVAFGIGLLIGEANGKEKEQDDEC